MARAKPKQTEKQHLFSVLIKCVKCDYRGCLHEKTSLIKLTCPTCGGKVHYVKEQGMSKRIWKEDDRVLVDFEGEPFAGFIAELLTKTKAKVVFDDGDVYDIKLKDLQPEGGKEEFKPEGFSQYNINWDKKTINFKFEAAGGKFWGWWRKGAMRNTYAIDIYVKYKDENYSVETLPYVNADPREDLQSLDADICAAVNKWFYHKCEGNLATIEDLRQRANKPTILIHRLESLDKIILKLKEYRDTALRSGGLRVMTFTGDEPDRDPKEGMRIQMDLTSQALALGKGGKVPTLLEGALFDSVADDSSKKGKREKRTTEVTTDSKNVDDLVKKLKTSKDKTEQRKIRGLLRKMGHRGGARAEDKKEGGKK